MDFGEFLKLMSGKNQFTMGNDDVIKAFQIFDRDRLGYLMSFELRMAFKRLEMNIRESEIDEILQDRELEENRRIAFKGIFSLLCLGMSVGWECSHFWRATKAFSRVSS